MSPLEKAVEKMKSAVADRGKAIFALPENRFHKHARKRDELASRRGVKKLVRPENCAGLLDHLPEPGGTTTAIVRGDFVVGDMLPALLARIGPVPHLWLSTLALSVRNAETLRALAASGAVEKITLICSHYFREVDKTSVFHAVAKLLDGIAELKVARCHAKIILAGSFVFEGSFNLRSSDTIEQITIFNDPELFNFHARWMDEVKTMPSHSAKLGQEPCQPPKNPSLLESS